MKISCSILSVLASGVPLDSNFYFRENQLDFEHLISAAKQIEGFYMIDNSRSANIQFGFDSTIFSILGRVPKFHGPNRRYSIGINFGNQSKLITSSMATNELKRISV